MEELKKKTLSKRSMARMDNRQTGITLIALVISIIVMLILAGVSLNMTIGENGIVTKAQEASKQHQIATELENLNLELSGLNIDTITNDESLAIQEIVNELISKEVIDRAVTTSNGQIAVGIDTVTKNKYFFGIKGDNTYKISRNSNGVLVAELTQNVSGGDITGGYALVTAENFNNSNDLPVEEKGKFTITSDSEVVFMDKLSGNLSIYVKSGVHATLGIYADMTLTNKNIKRSAIHIEEGGILDMFIDKDVKVTVNSGYGEAGVTADGLGAEGGPGGYAGIYVPATDTNKNGKLDTKEHPAEDGTWDSYGTLNLSGEGTLIAYGGNAGAGGGAVSENTGGGGGGGAGAGIGGNGGKGGQANTKFLSTARTPVTNCGSDGESGGDCGKITINDEIEIFAYGGAGAGGGYDESTNSGSGAGGYPAAGIGGGGAGGGGGEHACSAGGYTVGNGEDNSGSGKNGSGGTGGGSRKGAGGGYYSKGSTASGHQAWFSQGGIWANGNISEYILDHAGNGGDAGAGGEVNYNDITKIHAYNGNRITEENFDYNKDYYGYDADGELLTSGTALTVITRKDNVKIIPAYIFAQGGTIRSVYRTNQRMTEEECALYNVDFINSEETVDATKVVNVEVVSEHPTNTTIYGQGIGSGAGNLEKGNGTVNKID